MNYLAINIVVFNAGIVTAVGIQLLGRRYRANHQRRITRRETLNMVYESRTPSSVTRLEAWEFVLTLKGATSWILATNPLDGSLALTVSEGPDKMPVMYNGPNPLDMKSYAYSIFLDEVKKVVKARDEEESRL